MTDLWSELASNEGWAATADVEERMNMFRTLVEQQLHCVQAAARFAATSQGRNNTTMHLFVFS
jgi:hypothetical protein